MVDITKPNQHSSGNVIFTLQEKTRTFCIESSKIKKKSQSFQFKMKTEEEKVEKKNLNTLKVKHSTSCHSCFIKLNIVLNRVYCSNKRKILSLNCHSFHVVLKSYLFSFELVWPACAFFYISLTFLHFL